MTVIYLYDNEKSINRIRFGEILRKNFISFENQLRKLKKSKYEHTKST